MNMSRSADAAGEVGCAVAERRCECGTPLPPTGRPGRPRRYCSSWCRARHAQGLEPQRPPSLLPPPRSIPNTGDPPPAPGGPPPQPQPGPERREAVPPPPPRRALVERVRGDLEAAGVLESWEAAAALDVAAALDGYPGTGSARAALHRELRAIMGDALRGTNDTSTSVGRYRDELEERRRRREERAGAGG
jgi:hypothetical protein